MGVPRHMVHMWYTMPEAFIELPSSWRALYRPTQIPPAKTAPRLACASQSMTLKMLGPGSPEWFVDVCGSLAVWSVAKTALAKDIVEVADGIIFRNRKSLFSTSRYCHGLDFVKIGQLPRSPVWGSARCICVTKEINCAVLNSARAQNKGWCWGC